MSVKSFHIFSGRNDFLFILARFLQGDDNGDVTVSIPSEIMRILCYETLKHGRSSKRLLNVLSNNINMLIFTKNYARILLYFSNFHIADCWMFKHKRGFFCLPFVISSTAWIGQISA